MTRKFIPGFLGLGAIIVMLGSYYAAGRLGFILVLLMLTGALILPVVLQIATSSRVLFVTILCTTAVLLPSLGYWLALPSYTQYLVDALILVFLASTLVTRYRAGLPVRADISVLLFIVVLVMIVLADRSISIGSLQSTWALALGPLLLLAFRNSGLTRADSKRVLRVLFILCLLQFAVVVVQKPILHFEDVDSVGGTFGRAGTTYIGVIMSFLWIALAAHMTSTKSWHSAILLLVPLVTMGLAEAKAGFFFASAGTLFLTVAWLLKGRHMKALKALMIAIMPLLLGYLLLRFFPEFIAGSKNAADYWLRALADPQGQWDFYRGYTQGGQAQRIASYELVWNTLQSQNAQLFGLGLGTLNTDSFFGAGSSLGSDMAFTLAWVPGGGRLLLETGIVGVSGFCLLLLSQLRHSVAALRGHDIFSNTLAIASAGIIPAFLLAGFYTPSWTYRAVSIPFWVFVAMVQLQREKALAPRPSRVTDVSRQGRLGPRTAQSSGRTPRTLPGTQLGSLSNRHGLNPR